MKCLHYFKNICLFCEINNRIRFQRKQQIIALFYFWFLHYASHPLLLVLFHLSILLNCQRKNSGKARQFRTFPRHCHFPVIARSLNPSTGTMPLSILPSPSGVYFHLPKLLYCFGGYSLAHMFPIKSILLPVVRIGVIFRFS